MKNSPFPEALALPKQAPHSRNLIRSLMAATALGATAMSCATPPSATAKMPTHAETASGNPASKPVQATPSTDPELATLKAINNDLDAQVIHMLIVARRSNQAWPNIPAECVYTGVVLVHDVSSEPHRIVLENMCLQRFKDEKNVYDGEHLMVEADKNGRYELPFESAHLEEQNKQLFFVLQSRDRVIKEALEPGPYQPGTLSFEDKLDTYDVADKEW